VLYGDAFAKPGLVDLAAVMPELDRSVNQYAIDLVYTWVDHRDPAWRVQFDEADRSGAGEDAKAGARFWSNDELKYSLRSVHLHMPWAGTIHIVSSCLPPEWLDTSHPRLRWIGHEAILPANCLPTFNSHAIEASLHRIEGLSDRFIYFNDDFLVLDDLAPSDFINENGTLTANLEARAVVNAEPRPGEPDYLNAARNAARLLYEHFGYYPTRLHRHSPYALSVPLLQELETAFPAAFEQTRKAKFRAVTDINVASFMAHHFGFWKRDVAYGEIATSLIKSNDPVSLLKLRDLVKERRAGRPTARIVCVNEAGAPEPTAQWRQEIRAFMESSFPVPAPWERDGDDR
jgi:hypothetical protein